MKLSVYSARTVVRAVKDYLYSEGAYQTGDFGIKQFYTPIFTNHVRDELVEKIAQALDGSAPNELDSLSAHGVCNLPSAELIDIVEKVVAYLNADASETPLDGLRSVGFNLAEGPNASS